MPSTQGKKVNSYAEDSKTPASFGLEIGIEWRIIDKY
jgi:hypothetical protein